MRIVHDTTPIGERHRIENAVAASESTAEITSIAFVVLAESGQIDGGTAGEHAELFEEWAVGISYPVGALRNYEGKLYKCLQAHTSQADWTPDVVPALWALAADPAEEWPEWQRVYGAHDAYPKGAKVSHQGKHWISDIDGNGFEPGVAMWTEAAE